jgi:hypothetical protein
MRSFVGLSGESRSVDANQSYFHASAIPPALQVRPAPPNNPSVPPVHRPDVPCETQQAPNLEAPAATVAQTGLNPRSSNTRRVGGPTVAGRRADLEKARAGVDTWLGGLLKKQARALKQERSGR